MIYGETYKVGYGETAQEFEVVAQAGDYDYEWSEAALFRKDGQLYYAADAGCSCNSFEETPEPVASWQEAVEKAKDWFADSYRANSYAADFAESCLRARQEGRL